MPAVLFGKVLRAFKAGSTLVAWHQHTKCTRPLKENPLAAKYSRCRQCSTCTQYSQHYKEKHLLACSTHTLPVKLVLSSETVTKTPLYSPPAVLAEQ
jgi:hypothetical protein